MNDAEGFNEVTAEDQEECGYSIEDSFNNHRSTL